MRRRSLLKAGGLVAGATLAPWRPALASASSAKRFVFVVSYGGWDPTKVFATEFDNPNVDLERDADWGTAGDLTFVDHEDRPSVRSYLESYHDRSVILNGVLVPSVAHENCLHLVMTGTTSSTASDWPAIIASEHASDHHLPQVVLAGPSFPGDLGGVVTRTGASGQLEGLLTGDIVGWSDVATAAPERFAEDVMDAYMARRVGATAQAALGARDAALNAAYLSSLERASSLKDLVGIVDWSSSSGLADQVRLAVDLLSLGISRCATLSSGYSWDSHSTNDSTQSANFENLFSALSELMAALEATPSPDGGVLADDTVVVVISEMGRTPQLNDADGKDHWPYTSMMITGPGLAGGQVIGGFDESYYGRRLDLESGSFDDDANDLSVDVVGATLLQLAGIDSEAWQPGVGVLEAALRG